MTLLGKIFTLLVFIMSLVFMSFSVLVFATHRNWQEEAVALKGQLDTAKNTNESLRVEINNLKLKLDHERSARRHALGALEEKYAEASQLLEQKEADLRSLQADHGEAAQALKIAQMNVDALRAEVVKLREEIRLVQLDRDEKFATVVQLKDKLSEALGVQTNLQERQAQLMADISAYARVMKVYGLTKDTDVSRIPPDLKGIVTAVGDRNLIEVSLGSDDGLKVGHRVDIYRAGTYLGHAVVMKTDPDRSVAKIDEKTQKGIVKERDSVATKISSTRTG